MSGLNENENYISSNLFESLGLNNINMASPSSIAQAQSFLNQLLFNNSYQSILQSQYPSNNFMNQNYGLPPFAAQLIQKSQLIPNPYPINNQADKVQKETSLSNHKNSERLKYLNDLINNSGQNSNLKLEKSLIYEHRLFPLLKFMFEKCELATMNPDILKSNDKKLNNESDVGSTIQSGFDAELRRFLKENEHKLMDQSLNSLVKNSQNSHIKQVFASVDELMLNVILVLRINLIEIEKVNELCNDFAEQYVEALKIKLNSDNIFNIDEDDDEIGNEVEDEFKIKGLNFKNKSQKNKKSFSKKLQKISNDLITTSTPVKREHSPFEISPNVSLSKIRFNMQSNEKTENQSDLSNSLSTDIENHDDINIDEENDDNNLSINVEDDTDEFDETDNTSVKSQPSLYAEKSSSSSSSCMNKTYSSNSNNDDPLGSKNKRGVLPKSATNVMKKWLFQHIVHPYPTEEEKKQIAQKTNLTLIQVNNWFINARRRILQPMLEASNPDLTKKKKSSQVSSLKPYQNNRYWPSNLSNLSQIKPSNESKSYSSTDSPPSCKKLKTEHETHQDEVQTHRESNENDNKKFYNDLLNQINPVLSSSVSTTNNSYLNNTHYGFNFLVNNAESSNFLNQLSGRNVQFTQPVKKDHKTMNAFKIENLLGKEEKSQINLNNKINHIHLMQQQFFQQLQSYNSSNSIGPNFPSTNANFYSQ